MVVKPKQKNSNLRVFSEQKQWKAGLPVTKTLGLCYKINYKINLRNKNIYMFIFYNPNFHHLLKNKQV